MLQLSRMMATIGALVDGTRPIDSLTEMQPYQRRLIADLEQGSLKASEADLTSKSHGNGAGKRARRRKNGTGLKGLQSRFEADGRDQ